jgi:hypothetical protein
MSDGEVDTDGAGGATEDDPDQEASESQDEPLDLAPSERRLVTQPYDLGVRSITDDIESGRISLNIEYQRKYVWDSGKASRLIESLLLNVPIPVCYFAEDDEGVYEVIDGLQRLTAIRMFLDDKLTLVGVSVLTELIGLKYSDLNPRDQRRLEGRTIRCIVITADSHPDIKFDVFERLNTGAAMLTAQELRNSVYRGELNDALKDIAQQPYFRSLVPTSTNRRMEHEELVLRYFSLVDGKTEYKPPLRQFLNQYMRENRASKPEPTAIERFQACCQVVSATIGELPFKVPGSNNPLNKALFDAIMVPAAFANHDEMRANADQLRGMLKTLSGDSDFVASIGRATADRSRMVRRINSVANFMSGLGITVTLPPRFLPEAESA